MPITDNFAGLSNNADLSTLSAWDKSWFGSSQAGQISGDNRAGNVGIDYTSYAWTGGGHTAIGYRRNDGTFPDDQYAQLLVPNEFSNSNVGPAIRMDNGGSNSGNGYIGVIATDWAAIRDVVNGSATNISTSPAARTIAGSTVKIDASGTTITTYDDGVSATSTTDAGGHSSGNPGVAAYGSSSGNPEFDDFECSDLAAAGAGGIVIPRLTAARRHILTR